MSAQESILNGRYRLLSQQGSGGMAVVYKAQDVRLGRTVAVKVLRPSLTADPSFLQRFQQEARNVANLAHPNIVTLHDFGQDANTYYMVMEFIDGQDLKKIIRGSAPFTVERALHIAIQICAGIGYAHRAGLIHADVKPQNILITGSNDTVKVTDFGIAQALSVAQQMERQSVVWGSPHYFAPEQATGEPPHTASDVYAIGIVMFEMLTGKLPYSGADQQELAMAHIREQVPHVMELNPNVPIHLDRIIYKVMAKEPAQRYRTADQLGRILISYQKQGQEMTQNQGLPAAGSQPQPIQPGQSISSQPAPTSPAPQPIPLRPSAGNTPSGQASAAPPASLGSSAALSGPQLPQPSPASPSAQPPASQAQPAQPRPIPLQPQLSPSKPVPAQPPTPPQPASQVQGNTYSAGGGYPAGQYGGAGQGGGSGYAPGYGAQPQPQPASPPPAAYPTPGAGASRPNTPGGVPSAYPPAPSYLSESGPSRPAAPSYQVATRPASVDVVSILLGMIAFAAIIGLVVLWLAVLGAYR
jgi:serine/threonine-protein kinase